MTIDEDAAKVAQAVIDCVGNDGDWFDKDQAVEVIAAFGRRCAETMRGKCTKEIEKYVGYDNASKFARIVRQVEVK